MLPVLANGKIQLTAEQDVLCFGMFLEEKHFSSYFWYCDTAVYSAGLQFIRQEIELGAVQINELLESYFRLFQFIFTEIFPKW